LVVVLADLVDSNIRDRRLSWTALLESGLIVVSTGLTFLSKSAD
jgi:hypothetical protein